MASRLSALLLFASSAHTTLASSATPFPVVNPFNFPNLAGIAPFSAAPSGDRLRVLMIAPNIDGTDIGEAYVAFKWAEAVAEITDLTVLSFQRPGRAALRSIRSARARTRSPPRSPGGRTMPTGRAGCACPPSRRRCRRS